MLDYNTCFNNAILISVNSIDTIKLNNIIYKDIDFPIDYIENYNNKIILDMEKYLNNNKDLVEYCELIDNVRYNMLRIYNDYISIEKAIEFINMDKKIFQQLIVQKIINEQDYDDIIYL